MISCLPGTTAPSPHRKLFNSHYLDEFISAFEEEDPGRYPPVSIRRELLVEAKHSCAICRERTPIEFHHIIEFSTLGHYDSQYMLAVCPTDHALCTKGIIDRKAQYQYKANLSSTNRNDGEEFLYSIGPANFSWEDLRQIIISLHDSVVVRISQGESKFDFSEVNIDRKNEINRIGENYYNTVIVRHEPYFKRIQDFLENPVNGEIVELYYQVVDEIRSKIALNRNQQEHFEYFLSTFADVAVADIKDGRSQDRRTLNILMSFMYVNCDIGEKE